MKKMTTNQNLTWFQSLSTPEVAEIVQERGPRTIVFAAGGTTRWFILNYLDGWPKDMSYWQEYLTQGGRQFLKAAQMFFDHGVRTLFTHAIVPGQLGKSKGYLPLALSAGMEKIASSADFLSFYQEYGVRVHFFGNYCQVLKGSAHESTLAHFDEIEAQTQANNRHLLYWGFNSEHDQMTPILDLAVQYYRDHGRSPSQEEIITLHYKEPIDPIDIYIGFNRPKTSDLIPPLLEGQTDLYFTVGLSFDLSQIQFRSILYDHLFARQGRHRDYGELSENVFSEMQAFYRLNQNNVIGLGQRYDPGAIWHAMPQVSLPTGWDKVNK